MIDDEALGNVAMREEIGDAVGMSEATLRSPDSVAVGEFAKPWPAFIWATLVNKSHESTNLTFPQCKTLP